MKLYLCKDQEGTYIFLNKPELKKFWMDGTENYIQVPEIGLKEGQIKTLYLRNKDEGWRKLLRWFLDR